MNITQQVAASIGTALFSVLLTNGFKSAPRSASSGRARVARGPASLDPAVIRRRSPTWPTRSATSFLVATVLVALCLVPALLLPRRKPAAADRAAARAGMHLPTALTPADWRPSSVTTCGDALGRRVDDA